MTQEMHEVMCERFSKDSLIALATVEGDAPHVRAVNAYYMDGAFYCVTNARSRKMQQIAKNSRVAVCGDWFTGCGMAESLGHVLDERNRVRMDTLRPAFAAWYSLGHVDEHDPDTILLKISLTQGVLMKHGKRYSFGEA